MSIFLDWDHIEDESLRDEACERYKIEASELPAKNNHMERLWLKQSIIRIYAANNTNQT